MSPRAQAKIDRVIAALECRESDRVPIGESFWTNFVHRLKREWGVEDFNPYRHWDLDLAVVIPNMDPHITGIRTVKDTAEEKVVKTGFEATVRVKESYPMPEFSEFDTVTYEQMEAFEFDDPRDPRRYPYHWRRYRGASSDQRPRT